ncbi:MAG: hypothetical protein AAF546_07200 [Verrucomicrobiota bacterium]
MNLGQAAALAQKIAREDYESKGIKGKKPKFSTPNPDTIEKETMGEIPRFWVCSVDFSPPGKSSRDKVGIVTIDLLERQIKK